LYQSTIKEGRRHSAAAAFLTPIFERENLEVRPWTQVMHLLWLSFLTLWCLKWKFLVVL